MGGYRFLTWRKARKSGQGNGNCVEVAHSAPYSVIGVRDSKDRGGPVLETTTETWAGLLNMMDGGDLERP